LKPAQKGTKTMGEKKPLNRFIPSGNPPGTAMIGMIKSLAAELFTKKAEEHLYEQMELEGIQVSGSNLIGRTNANVEDFPLVLLADIRNRKKLLFFDDTLPAELLEKLADRNPQSFDITSIAEELRIFGIETKADSFQTYTFPKSYIDRPAEHVKCLQRDDPMVTDFSFGGLGEKVFAIVDDGVILSACVSSRENQKAAESWVYSSPEHRRKGLAQQVVTAWAGSMLQDGKTPFYSHVLENIPSYKVAKKLGLLHLYDEHVLEAL
jgi:hypothetical protein